MLHLLLQLQLILLHICHLQFALESSGPSRASISPTLNLQVDATILLFPLFVQPRSSGSIHVDYPTTSFENVIILNELDMKSYHDLLHVRPPQKLKKSYDRTRKFQLERAAKLPWAKGVFITSGVLHNMRCKACTTIDRKPCLIAPKWDTLMKHIKFFWK